MKYHSVKCPIVLQKSPNLTDLLTSLAVLKYQRLTEAAKERTRLNNLFFSSNFYYCEKNNNSFDMFMNGIVQYISDHIIFLKFSKKR